MRQSKKEFDISKCKVRTAQTSFKTYMTPGDGSSAEDVMKSVVEGLKARREAEDKTAEAVEEEAEVVKAEAEKEQQLQVQQNAVTQVEESRIEHEMKDIKGKIPSRTKIIIAFIIAVVYDLTDLIATIFSAGGSEVGEWVGDLILQFAVFPFLLGPYFKMGKKSRILEFIPFVDALYPGYTLAVRKAWKASKGGVAEIKELKKEEKMLKGDGTGGAKGFGGFSGKAWAIIGVILLGVAVVSFLLLGMVGAIVIPMPVFLAILFFNEPTRGAATTIGIIALVLGGTGAVVVVGVAPTMSGYGGPFGDLMTKIAAFPTSMKAWWIDHNPIQSLKRYYRRQVMIATGDFYTGKVDENAEIKLGVFLEELKQADPVFYDDRPVTMFALLTVYTLDEPVNVTIGCKDDKLLKGASPTIFPREKFVVDTFEEQDIDCLFEAGKIQKGPSLFTLSADFNFKTMAYVKSYFMDQERLRSMRRDDIDPLDQYGIKEKSPTAIYTNGPVGIGMGVGKPPIGIDFEQPYETMTLGITLENKWEGKIVGVNRFIVILPKGFVMEEIGVPYTQVDCSELAPGEVGLCDDELNNVYIVEDKSFVEVARGNFKSYRAFLKINKGDYDKVLAEFSPVTTNYFKAIIDYTYRLEKTKTITIKSRQQFGIGGLVEGADADMVAPSVESSKAEKVSENSVKMSWTTNEESVDIFEWWDVTKAPPVYQPLSTPNEAEYSKQHSRVLTGVSPGKQYGYKITSLDKAGNSGDITNQFSIVGP